MNSKTISVIIPVFNVEKYLERCIESVVSQTYNDLEILLIDDGSTDNSGNICDNYSITDSRIKVIHKKNGGVSSARNVGICECTGDFLVFVDSDDYISISMIEDYYNTLIKYDSNFVVYERKKSLLNKKVINKKSKDLLKFIITLDSYAPYAKLFDANIVRNNNILFDENLKACEDAPFIREYLLYCNKIAFIGGKNYYNYNTDNQNSLSRRGYLDYCLYFDRKMIVLQRLVNQIDIPENKKQAFISYRAVHGLYCSFNHYYLHFKDDFIELSQKSLDTLGRYIINREDLCEYKNWFNKYILSYFISGSIDYDFLKSYYGKKQGFIKRYISKIHFYIKNYY